LFASKPVKNFKNIIKKKIFLIILEYPLSGFWCFNTNDFGMEYSPKSLISGAIRITGIENQDRLKDRISKKIIKSYFLEIPKISNIKKYKIKNKKKSKKIYLSLE
jgi:hypothetical protein